MAFYQLILVVPQPAYYIVGEFIKIFGPYQELYYPHKSAIIGQIIFIIILYTPFFLNYHMVRRMIRTCVRLVHPAYDFKTGRIMLNTKKQSGHSLGAGHPTAAELDSLTGGTNSNNYGNYGAEVGGIVEEQPARNRNAHGYGFNAIEEEANESRSMPSNGHLSPRTD